jgi:hypothetical protein
VTVFGIWADHGSVVASGYFNNAGGNSRADGIAVYNGIGWYNVGTSANGADGPVSLNTTMFCVRVLGSKLYLGGLDSSIADNTMLGFAASFRFRQPDLLITTTSSYIGNDIYNTTGKGQTKSLTVHRTQTGTFTVEFVNDGLATDTYKVKGPGSSGAFSVKYFAGATDVTAQVVAGTYSLTMAPPDFRYLTIKVTVGAGATVGSFKSFLLTATSQGGGLAKDAVKAKVTAS